MRIKIGQLYEICSQTATILSVTESKPYCVRALMQSQNHKHLIYAWRFTAGGKPMPMTVSDLVVFENIFGTESIYIYRELGHAHILRPVPRLRKPYVNEAVTVWNNVRRKQPACFSHIDENGLYATFLDGETAATCTGKYGYWQNCRTILNPASDGLITLEVPTASDNAKDARFQNDLDVMLGIARDKRNNKKKRA